MNRLSGEKSPYLLQHASNPVNWYPWGEEAFEKARAEEKPIFLSIGYSTCHWCHVMERESFENREVADLLNEAFVSIKVDREERPDVDRVYMTFVQAATGTGGWPMSVWLTPDLRPFFGGTYFPLRSRWGRPGFIEVVQRIAALWSQERSEVRRQAHLVAERLRTLTRRTVTGPVPGAPVLERAVSEMEAAYDEQFGGFGAAPKFPRPAELLFLLREHARTGNRRALEMVVGTLEGMVRGGIRDHVGGGFHRYSVDAMWRVPHFEKMLYDQAQIALACLEAGLAAEKPDLLEAAAATLAYVQRELTDPAGGFYSAEDADSVPPAPAGDDDSGAGGSGSLLPGRESGERAGGGAPAGPEAEKAEGAFYFWTWQEVGRLLPAQDAYLFRLRFGLLPEGNAPEDPHGDFAAKNLLYVARDIDDLAAETGMAREEIEDSLERSLRVLFAARARRPRPHLDDKVITAWNGLMIAAFARAARVFAVEEPDAPFGASCLESAERAASFLREVMWMPGGTLLRRYREGGSSIEGYAEDYAFLIFGLLELFQAGGNPLWLEWAVELQRRQDELFLDEVAGGWFSTTGRDSSVLLRLKEDYDGAEPSATSVSAWNLLVLEHLFGEGDTAGVLDRAFGSFSRQLDETPRSAPMMLAALTAREAGLAQVVIVGPRGREDTRALERALDVRYRPFALRVPVDPQRQDELARLVPFVAPMRAIDGRATAYVCREFACRAPAGGPEEMEEQLNA